MAYFLVVPVFVVWLLVAGAAVFATRSAPRFHDFFPYVWRIALWATIGVVAANAVLIAALAFGLDPIGKAAPGWRHLAQLMWGLAATGGPLLVSPLGWAAGAAAGAILAVRKQRGSSVALTPRVPDARANS